MAARPKKMADGGLGSAPSWAASAPAAGSGTGGMGAPSAPPSSGGGLGAGSGIGGMAAPSALGGNFDRMSAAIGGGGGMSAVAPNKSFNPNETLSQYGGGPANPMQQRPMGGMNRFRGVGPAAAGTGMMPGGGGLRAMAKGGSVKENPKMTKKVAGYFAKKGNKSLAAHEYREAAGKEEDTPAIAKREMKALKGAPAGMKNYEKKEHSAMGMNCGGKVMKYAKGGGIESKGKTQGKMIKMASGGSVSSRADGIASRGKTNCKMR